MPVFGEKAIGIQFLPPRKDGDEKTTSPFLPSAASDGSPGRFGSLKIGRPVSSMPSAQEMSFTKGTAETNAPSSRFRT